MWGEHDHIIGSGTIDLRLEFDTPTAEPLTAVILASYHNVIKMKNGHVELDYTI